MSSPLFFFDTETTGIPDWKTPSGGDNQPHIVQVAAATVDPESHEIIDHMDLIVKPDGWDIPQETIDVHGITNEHAAEHGEPENEVLRQFLQLWSNRKRIAFNTTFDNRIIRIATKRFCDDQIIDSWKGGEYECAMIGSRKVMGGRNPKLVDAYRHFTGQELEGAHDAWSDMIATIDVYFGMKKAMGI